MFMKLIGQFVFKKKGTTAFQAKVYANFIFVTYTKPKSNSVSRDDNVSIIRYIDFR